MAFCSWWLRFGYTIVEIGTAAILLSAWSDELATAAGAGWEAWVVFGLWTALAVMLAWPLFLLIWLTRQSVKSEFEGWPY